MGEEITNGHGDGERVLCFRFPSSLIRCGMFAEPLRGHDVTRVHGTYNFVSPGVYMSRGIRDDKVSKRSGGWGPRARLVHGGWN